VPNHVTTIIEGPSEVLATLVRNLTDTEVGQRMSQEARLAKVYTDSPYTPKNESEIRAEQVVDFDLLIPQPDNIEKGNCSGKHEPGVVCWYNWSVQNWGTKWNAYDAEIGDTSLKFDTAWSHPVPVIVTLSTRFPKATLYVKYADEDLGANLGEYTIKDGIIIDQTPFDEGSDEATDFASIIKYGMPYAEMRAEWGLDEDDE
jgi:hypothetical protein